MPARARLLALATVVPLALAVGAGSASAWKDITLRRLPSWGFNTFGNWSDRFYKNGRVPYVASVGIWGDHARVSSGSDYWPADDVNKVLWMGAVSPGTIGQSRIGCNWRSRSCHFASSMTGLPEAGVRSAHCSV